MLRFKVRTLFSEQFATLSRIYVERHTPKNLKGELQHIGRWSKREQQECDLWPDCRTNDPNVVSPPTQPWKRSRVPVAADLGHPSFQVNLYLFFLLPANL